MKSPSSTLIRLGTRGSDLARWQADHVGRLLRAGGFRTEVVIIQTTGDLDQRTAFGALGAKGIFVKEIEAALLEGRIDIAVHSLKDLPTELPEGLRLGAVLERESPWDALISRNGDSLENLPAGSTIATGSLRRGAQVLAIRPDLRLAPLRGNVPTRIRKIRDGSADATLLALAGLKRLKLETEASEIFSASRITPSMGQGALGLEARAEEFEDVLRMLEHPASRTAVEAERAFIRVLGGGCKTPAGVLAEPETSGAWTLTGLLASSDGSSLLRETLTGLTGDELIPAARRMASGFRKRADQRILQSLETPSERIE